MKQVTSPKTVDIVIPVYNRFEHTKQTLESLFKNTNPDLYNVYIIDDCSTDSNVRSLLNDLAGRVPVFKNKENIGPGASRNWVCDWITKKKLRSKYLYHSDNDVYFKEGWLERLIEWYEKTQHEDILVLGGGCHPYLQNKYKIGDIGIKDAVSGYSQLMDWRIWERYGPFDETMRGQKEKIMGSEDYAFCQKIIKDGFKVGAIEPEVVIQTGKTNTYGELATGSETFKEVEGVMIK